MSSGSWLLGPGRSIDCTTPRIMAILNATPDSFHAGSRVMDNPAARAITICALLEQKPDIIDVGGQSTRPGSERVGAEEELRRVIPVIEEIRRLDSEVPVTIDTYDSRVAAAALDSGADAVNDISAGRMDPKLLSLVAERGCGYVLMHMQGTPESMQDSPHYDDCMAEVSSFLAGKLSELDGLGIPRERVLLDPGIGFGKRLQDNLALIRGAEQLAELGRPLLYGVSRKRFIGTLSGEEYTEKRLSGTLGVTWELLRRGVMLHRVHDPAPVRQLMKVWAALAREE